MQDTIEVFIKTELSLFNSIIETLNKLGFEAFMEEEDGFYAYIPTSKFNPLLPELLKVRFPGISHIRINKIPYCNWNIEWEKQFEPVVIEPYRFIAPFHEKSTKYLKEFIIHPGMAFGTGHHETTRMMIQAMDKIEFQGKKVLDFGTGTGILSLFAAWKGATEVIALDNDPAAAESIAKNKELNQISNIRFFEYDLANLEHEHFDIILANISRNVIIHYKQEISKRLNTFGYLLTSGFYSEDVVFIKKEMENSGLKLIDTQNLNNWSLCIFVK